VREFQAEVLSPAAPLVWVVHFYSAAGVGQDVTTQVEKAASSLLGLAAFGAVLCDLPASQKLCTEQGSGLRLYTIGSSKAGEKLQVSDTLSLPRAVRQQVEARLPSLSTRLTKENQNTKLVPQSAPLPRVLLFSAKLAVPLTWRAASGRFRGRVSFFHVLGADPRQDNCSLCERFSIQRVPSVLKLSPSGGSTAAVMPEGSNLTRWLEQQMETEKEGRKAPTSGDPAAGAGVQVPELTRASLMFACGESAPLCVIGLATRAKAPQLIALLQEVASKAKLRNSKKVMTPNVFYSWVDSTTQKAFAAGFALPSVKFHQMVIVAYKPRRKRFVVYIGSSDANSIEEFVLEVLSGDVTLTPVSSMPALK